MRHFDVLEKNLLKRIFQGLGFLVVFTIIGCHPNNDSSERTSGVSKSDAWRPFQKTDRDKEREFAGSILILAFDGKFEELDQYAEKLRRERTQHSDGSWAVDNFFNAFSEYDSYNQVDPERWQPILEKRLHTWIEDHPESVPARIALSGFYGDYAWAVINTHVGGPLSDEQRLIIKERLNKALVALREAGHDVRDWPSAWTLYLALGRPVGFSKGEVLELFPEMQKADPNFWHLYAEMVTQYLVPWRQGSSHREWNDWLVNALDRAEITAKDRDIIYARVVLNLMHYDYRRRDLPDPFKVAGVDWERLQQGTRALMAAFPESTRLPTYYLSASTLKGDEDAIREALSVLKPHYDPGLWLGRSDSEFFELLELLKTRYPSSTEIIE